MRLFLIFLGLAGLVLVPFVIWGHWFEAEFTGEALTGALRSWGRAWGWLLGLLLLIGDLLLPVPGTAVMSGLGFLYGTVAGGAIAAAGSWLSGALAYWLCLRFGEKWAARLMGEDGAENGRRIFSSHIGGLMVALSRCLPLLPEVIACMAGLSKMPCAKFLSALACGSLPIGFIFAWIGAAGHDAPGLALALSAAIPLALYLLALVILKLRNRPVGQTTSSALQ